MYKLLGYKLSTKYLQIEINVKNQSQVINWTNYNLKL